MWNRLHGKLKRMGITDMNARTASERVDLCTYCGMVLRQKHIVISCENPNCPSNLDDEYDYEYESDEE